MVSLVLKVYQVTKDQLVLPGTQGRKDHRVLEAPQVSRALQGTPGPQGLRDHRDSLEHQETLEL